MAVDHDARPAALRRMVRRSRVRLATAYDRRGVPPRVARQRRRSREASVTTGRGSVDPRPGGSRLAATPGARPCSARPTRCSAGAGATAPRPPRRQPSHAGGARPATSDGVRLRHPFARGGGPNGQPCGGSRSTSRRRWGAREGRRRPAGARRTRSHPGPRYGRGPRLSRRRPLADPVGISRVDLRRWAGPLASLDTALRGWASEGRDARHDRGRSGSDRAPAADR